MFRMLATAAAIATLGALPAFLLGAQYVLVAAELSLDERDLGLAVGVFFASAALASAPAGSLADRLGARRSMAVAGALSTAAALVVAVLASSLLGLLVGLAVAGAANAALSMTANATLARSVPPGRRGLAFGVKQSAVPVALLLGGLAVPAVGLAVGWRWTYGIVAVCGALVVVAALRQTSVARSAPVAGTRGEHAPVAALVLTGVATSMANAAANSLGAFLPAWTFSLGMSPQAGGLLLALGAALCAVGRVVSGIAADRRGGRNLPVVAGQMAAAAVGLLLLSQGDLRLVVLGALIAFALGWSWPGLLIFAVVRVGRDRPALASSAVQAGGFAGGALGPPLFGWLVVSTSYETGWRVAALVSLAAAGLLLWTRRLFLRDLTLRPLPQP